MIHLVTGACGFLGSAIVENLVKKKHRVISIDIIEDKRISSISEFHKINILDIDKLAKIFKTIDCVHHNAALVPLSKSGKKQIHTMHPKPNFLHGCSVLPGTPPSIN